MYRSKALWTLLAVGLALRLIYGLAQDPLGPYGPTGGDDPWYLANALALVTDAPGGTVIHGISTTVSMLGQPPVFFIAAGIPQALLPPGAAVVAIRILHALATTAVALFAFGLAVRLVEGVPKADARLARRAGLIAAAALALSPALILEAAQVKTESLFVFFVTGGVWAYVEAVVRDRTSLPGPLSAGEGMNRTAVAGARHGVPRSSARWFALAGLLLGLATLTRAVFLAFPLALVVFTVAALGGRTGWKRALLLLAVYAAVVGSWTAYNLARYQRFVLAGEGLPAFFYHGVTGWDDPAQVDQRLEEARDPDSADSPTQSDYVDAAGEAIRADVGGYLARRLGELGGALLQPHNTELFPGESLRAMAAGWWANDRTPGGLAALTRADGFWPKLLLYVVHYTGLVLGAAGALLTWRSWRVGRPMLGYIAYTLLVHLFLFALPRYLFPFTPFVWVFAAAAVAAASSKLKVES